MSRLAAAPSGTDCLPVPTPSAPGSGRERLASRPLLAILKVSLADAASIELPTRDTRDTAGSPARGSHDARTSSPPTPRVLLFQIFLNISIAHVCTPRCSPSRAMHAMLFFFFFPLLPLTAALLLFEATLQCHKRNNNARKPSGMSKQVLACPSNMVPIAKSVADTFDICAKRRKGRGALSVPPVLLRSRCLAVELCSIFDTFRKNPTRDDGKTFWSVRALFSCEYRANRSRGLF